jgi:AcrR family transcriptional regulator
MSQPATAIPARRKAQTRRRLLAVARKLFSRRGLGQVSVDEIIRAARSSKGSFYHHFRSKDELVLALIDSHTEAEIEALAGCLAEVQGGQPTEICDGVFRLIFRTYEDPAWVRLFMEFWVYAARNHQARGAIARMYGRWRSRVEDLLREGVESGVASAEIDPSAAATTLIAVHHGLLLQASVDPKTSRLPETAEALGRMLLRCLGLPSTQGCAQEPRSPQGGP